MSKHILFTVFSLFCISVFFVSCDDEPSSDPLVGDWKYKERATSNCITINNELVDYSGNGNCETIDNITTCHNYLLKMNSGHYSITKKVEIGNDETSTIEEEGTYKYQGNAGFNIIFCTDIICRTTNYSIIDNSLLLESMDTNTGCTIVVTAKRG